MLFSFFLVYMIFVSFSGWLQKFDFLDVIFELDDLEYKGYFGKNDVEDFSDIFIDFGGYKC